MMVLRRCAAIIFLHLLSPSNVVAENIHNETYQSRPPREVIWSFDSNLMNFDLTLPDASRLQGLAGAFAVGYGRTRENSWLIARLHVISGPWNESRNGNFDSDYSGTMFDVEYGTAFPRLKLRSGSRPILTIAGGHMDISGRNIGGNKKSKYVAGNYNSTDSEQSFKTGLGQIPISPSVGWSWTQASRPIGNQEDLLQTRVESANVKFGAVIPLYSRARVTVNKRGESSKPDKQVKGLTSSGPVNGYAMVSSISVWQGI